MSDEKPRGQVMQIDEARIRDHLGEMVRPPLADRANHRIADIAADMAVTDEGSQTARSPDVRLLGQNAKNYARTMRSTRARASP